MQKQHKQTHVIASHKFSDGRLLELVFNNESQQTSFAYWNGKSSHKIDSHDEPDVGRFLPIPASNNLIKYEAVVLPEKPEPYGSVEALVADIQGYLDNYVATSPWFRTFAAYYVLLTWLYDAFREIGYGRLQADLGSGKTRALLTIGSLCYRAFFAAGASSVSSIFHTLDMFRGTLILDEADFRYSNETAELTKVLNAGHTAGFPVFRTMPNHKREFSPRAFFIYGPKLIAMRRSFDDDALESRFITERLDRIHMPHGMPINLPAIQKEEALALRNKLLQYRFDHFHTAHIDESLADPTLSPRTNQILVPLLSIIPDQASRSIIKKAVRAQETERATNRASSVTGDLVSALSEARKQNGGVPISIAEIATQLIKHSAGEFDRPITNRYVGSLLRARLGLVTYKSNGIFHVSIDDATLTQLRARYGIDQEEKK